MITNVNDVTKEMIADKFIEWLQADMKYQKAREGLWSEGFAHIDYEEEKHLPREFSSGNKPYREPESLLDIAKRFHEALESQNRIYDDLIELSHLYLAKING